MRSPGWAIHCVQFSAMAFTGAVSDWVSSAVMETGPVSGIRKVVEGLDGEELVAVPQEGAQEARTERYLLEKREGG